MDIGDLADGQAQPILDAALAEARARAAADKVLSIEGECDVCGNESKRLVACLHPKDGIVWACAPCRDNHKLPLKRN